MRWPTAFANNQRNSYINESVDVGELLWSYTVDADEGLQTIYGHVVGYTHLWLCTVRQEPGSVSSRFLYCLDLDGNLISRTQITSADVWNQGNGFGLSLDSNDNCYLAITTNSGNQNEIRKYLPDGTLDWTWTKNSDVPGNPPHYSCPAIDENDYIYVARRDTVSGTSWITKLDTSGSIVSEFDTSIYSVSSDLPLVIDGTGIYVIGRTSVGTQAKYIRKFDYSGVQQWSFDVTTVSGPSYSRAITLSLQGNLLAAYCIGSTSGILAITADTGAHIWHHGIDLDSNNLPCLAIAPNGNVFPGNVSGFGLVGLDGSTGSLLWEVNLSSPFFDASTQMPTVGNDGLRWAGVPSPANFSTFDSTKYDLDTGKPITCTQFEGIVYQAIFSESKAYFVTAGNPFSSAFSQPSNPATISCYACDLTISPDTVSMQVGSSQVFTANHDGVFSVEEAGGGTVEQLSPTTAEYTAPGTPGTYHVDVVQSAEIESSWYKNYKTESNNRDICSPSDLSTQAWSYTLLEDPDEYLFGDAVVDRYGNVYVRSVVLQVDASGRVYKFNKHGALLWIITVASEFPGSTGSIPQQGGIAVDDTQIYVTFNDMIACYSTADGSLVWSYDSSVDGPTGFHPFSMAPAIDVDGNIHIATTAATAGTIFQSYAYCFAPDGTVVWKTLIWDTTDTDIGPDKGCACINGDHVYYTAKFFHVQSLDRTTGTIEWTSDVSASMGSYTKRQHGSVYANTYLYLTWSLVDPIPGTDKEMTAWDTIANLATGSSFMSTVDGGSGYGGTLAAIDQFDSFYVCAFHTMPGFSDKGRLIKYKSNGTELWHFEVLETGEDVFSAVIAGDCVVVVAAGDDDFPVVNMGHLYRLNKVDGSLIDSIHYTASGSETTHGAGGGTSVTVTHDSMYVVMGRTLYAYDTGGEAPGCRAIAEVTVTPAGGCLATDIPGVTKIVEADTDTELFQLRVHRQQKNQMNGAELYFCRENNWQLFPIQPDFSKDNSISISRKYREPSTCQFTIADTFGLLNRRNRNSPYNYQSDTTTFDPVMKAKRLIMLRVGTLCYQNLTTGITPASSLAPALHTLGMLTDDAFGVISSSGDEYVTFNPSDTTPVDIDVDLGSTKWLVNYAIRFGTESGLGYTLPASVQWGWSDNGTDWKYVKWPRPIGGDGGDYQDDLGVGGKTVEAFRTDIQVYGRYVRFRITPAVGGQTFAIDELAVYGENTIGFLGGSKFVGYLGGDITPYPNGNVVVTATDIIKKLIDNNSKRLTAQYGGGAGPIDAADILYSLLTSSTVWKGLSGRYDAPFTAAQIGWTSGSDAAKFKFPVWQGQSNNIYGYVGDILHSIGFDLQPDREGVFQLFEPPYRQVIPDRVFIADDDGNNDCWLVTPHDDDVDLRNKVIVRSGNPQSGATATVKVQPNSIGEFGELLTEVDDPIAFDETTREKIASYILRDYAWRLGTLTANIHPDFDTNIRRVVAFRASRRASLYAKAYDATENIRAQDLWAIDQIDETIWVGDWTAVVKCNQYVGLGPNSPLNLTATPRIGDNTIIDLDWDAPADTDIKDYAIYVSDISDSQFPSTPSFYVGGVTTSFAVIGLTPGTQYWFYVTAIGQNGQESVPSSVVTAEAGGAPGDESNWTITDLAGSLLQGTNHDGIYEYEVLLTWTSPPVGADAFEQSAYGFKHGEFRYAIGAIPASPTDPNSWKYQDEWHGDRIPSLLTWDRATVGDLTWYPRFRSDSDLTGVTVYFRVFTWQTTNGFHGPAHASNIASVTF